MDIRVASNFFWHYKNDYKNDIAAEKALFLPPPTLTCSKCFFAADSEEENCWVTIYNHPWNWIISNNSPRQRCWVLSRSQEHTCNWTSCIYYSLRWGKTQNGELEMLSNRVTKGLIQDFSLCEVIWEGFKEAGPCSVAYVIRKQRIYNWVS